LSGKAAILGAANVHAALAELDGYDEIVVLEESVDALLALVDELADPRLDYVLGGLPVLPLPDGSVECVVGAPADDPEVARVTAR
jgi:hypothetical protein